MECEDVVPLDCVRLVKYNEYNEWIESSLDHDDDVAMETVLGGVKSIYSFDLLLETKRPEQTFVRYKPGGRSIHLLYIRFIIYIFISFC